MITSWVLNDWCVVDGTLMSHSGTISMGGVLSDLVGSSSVGVIVKVGVISGVVGMIGRVVGMIGRITLIVKCKLSSSHLNIGSDTYTSPSLVSLSVVRE